MLLTSAEDLDNLTLIYDCTCLLCNVSVGAMKRFLKRDGQIDNQLGVGSWWGIRVVDGGNGRVLALSISLLSLYRSSLAFALPSAAPRRWQLLGSS